MYHTLMFYTDWDGIALVVNDVTCVGTAPTTLSIVHLILVVAWVAYSGELLFFMQIYSQKNIQ